MQNLHALQWYIYPQSIFYTVADAFSLFVDSTFVIDGDFANFSRAIRDAWLEAYGDYYPDISITIVKSESFLVPGKRSVIISQY